VISTDDRWPAPLAQASYLLARDGWPWSRHSGIET